MLVGELIRLRALQKTDLTAFFRHVNDPEVTRNLLVDPPLSWEQEEVWYQNMQRGQDLCYTIEARDGKVIGNITLFRINWKDRHASLGIMIGEHEYQGKGYGTEAIRLMLDHAFGELNLERVCLVVMEGNGRAMRCYERCGFQKEGVLRSARFKDGRYVNDVVMSILKREWTLLNGK